MKVLALMLLLVAVTAAQWQGGPPIRNDAPPSGRLMSGQIGGRSVHIEDRLFSLCTVCRSDLFSDAVREAFGISEERCKAKCD